MKVPGRRRRRVSSACDALALAMLWRSDTPHDRGKLKRGVLRLRDDPPEHDVVRPRLRRLVGGHAPLLVVDLSPGRPDSGYEQLKLVPILRTDLLGLQSAANHAVRPDGGALAG